MTLYTRRLELLPITLPMVEAVFANDRGTVEELVGASFPAAWPGRALIERAFSADLDEVRRDPSARLWGDRLMISRDERRIVGSVIFHGRPDDTGIAEVGYGVEGESQGLGYATEATEAAVEWAFTQSCVRGVSATTFPWHRASLRVIEKLGMVRVSSRDHELLGELWVFERRREASPRPVVLAAAVGA